MGLASKIKQEVSGTTPTGAPGATYGNQPSSASNPYSYSPSQQLQHPQQPSYNASGTAGTFSQPQFGQSAGYAQQPPATYPHNIQATAGQPGIQQGSSAQPAQAYGTQGTSYAYGTQPPQYNQQPQQYGQPQQPSAYGMHSQYGAAAPRPQQHPSASMSSTGGGSAYGYGKQYQPQQPQQQQQTPYHMAANLNMMAPQQQQPQQSNNDAASGLLSSKLQSIITANNLQPFYDATKFQAVLNKVLSINFDAIAAQWRIPRELAYDLAPLALYDIVFFCDDSGSMSFEENGKRIQQLKSILARVSSIATMFDDDGIVVRFMNSNVNGDGIRNPAEVSQLLNQVKYTGVTPLGTNFNKKVIEPFLISQVVSGTMAKPILAVIITDGEPLGEPRETLENVIRAAKDFVMTKSRYGGGALAVQIAQVGGDMGAQAFLAALDKSPMVGKMIDCTSGFELEQMEYAQKGVDLTQELWTLKVCVGAIDPSYDEADG